MPGCIFARDRPGYGVVHHWNRLSQFTRSRIAGRGTDEAWPASTDICCFHCTEPFDTQPVGIPMSVTDSKLVCDGNFCSYGCALAYTFAQGSSHIQYRTRQLLVQAARDIHGISNVHVAPPRLALKKFGGYLTIEEFRNSTHLHSIVVNPPFVGQDMVYETHSVFSGDAEDASSVARHATIDDGDETRRAWSVTGLKVPDVPLNDEMVLCPSEPLSEALFPKYVEQRERDNGTAALESPEVGKDIQMDHTKMPSSDNILPNSTQPSDASPVDSRPPEFGGDLGPFFIKDSSDTSR